MKNIRAIFIVAGHSKYNPGTSHGGLFERDVAITISNQIIGNLRAYNVEVYSVGVDEDLSLPDKIKRINSYCQAKGYNVNNSLMISIHTNAGGGTGLETFSYNDFEEGKGFGNKVLIEMQKTTLLRIRGAKYENQSQHPRLAIVHDTTPLALLVECGFIDHKDDSMLMRENPQAYSDGIVNGLVVYAGLEKEEEEENDFAVLYSEEKKKNELLEAKLEIAQNITKQLSSHLK